MKKLLSLLSVVFALSGGLAFLAKPVQARELPDFADLVERSGSAVVNIRTTERAKPVQPGPAPQMPEGIDENDPFYEFFRRFFPPRQGPAPGQRGRGE